MGRAPFQSCAFWWLSSIPLSQQLIVFAAGRICLAQVEGPQPAGELRPARGDLQGSGEEGCRQVRWHCFCFTGGLSPPVSPPHPKDNVSYGLGEKVTASCFSDDVFVCSEALARHRLDWLSQLDCHLNVQASLESTRILPRTFWQFNPPVASPFAPVRVTRQGEWAVVPTEPTGTHEGSKHRPLLAPSSRAWHLWSP